MSWQDEVRPASFRGVRFDAIDLSMQFGRRLIVDQYPGGDRHTTDDLGRKARTFRMRALISGPDYLDRRDALIAAIEGSNAPGTLVHPWRGTMQVRVGDAELVQDAAGGACVVEFDCTEASNDTSPVLEADVEAEAQTAADTAGDASDAIGDQAAADLEELASSYRTLVAQGVEAFLTVWADPIGELEDAALNLTASDIRTAFFGSIEDVRVLLRMAREYPAGTPRYTLGPAATPTEETAADILAAYLQTFRAGAIIRACEVAVAADYVTADAAEGQLADLVDVIEDELEEADDVDLFNSLIALRGAVVSALTDMANRLPRLRQITIGGVRHVLEVAHDLYGPTALEERAAEIVALNAIAQPGFVSGTLKVLSR